MDTKEWFGLVVAVEAEAVVGGDGLARALVLVSICRVAVSR